MRIFETLQRRLPVAHGNIVIFIPLVLTLLLLSGCGFFSQVPLTGEITDAYTGESVETAEIKIGQKTVDVDEDGEYQTTSWKGKDTLEVSAPGYETVRVALDSYAPSMFSDAEQVTLDMELRPTLLEGVVEDAYTADPVEGAVIEVIGTSDESEEGDESGSSDESGVAEAAESDSLRVETDEDGRYTLEGLAEEFTIVVSAPDYEPVETELERTTEYDVELRPNVLTGQVTDQYSDDPIEGAEVRIGSLKAETDDDGSYKLEDVPQDAVRVSISAEGYETISQRLRRTAEVDVSMRPDLLKGALVDEESGEPVEFATVIATESLTSTAIASVRIDNQTDGSFTLDGFPEEGYIQVLAPGYRKAVLEIEQGNIPTRIELEPFHARALYVKTSTAAYLPERMEKFYDLIDDTELNALVIDLKSDNLADLGLIYYDSQVPIVQELGTSADLMDIEGILAEAQRRNIYTIARIHVFAHDNLLAETMPEWAAQNINGCVPNENRKCNGDIFYADWDIAWLDPWNRNVWDYNIQLGIEAAQLGFDEVQFDYIRFPNDASDYEYMRLSKPIDWKNNPEPMYENIATFMEEAHEAMNSVGAFFSVDIFGYAVWAPQKQIGQSADIMAPHADYIYPMVYPSHFWTNELGFDNAAAHPYEIVYESLEFGQEMVGDKRAKMRPWLQDFTLIWVPDHLIVEYGVAEVRAQIRASEESPYGYGWAVWDPDNEYTLEAFRPEE